MFKKALHFIKYNNAMVFILALIFVFGTGVFAQTEAGQEFIGEKATKVEGIDNTLLIEADLDKFNMDFKIEKIEENEEYYFVTYTYLDLVEFEGAWQYQLQEKVRKVSKKLNKDLGEYLADELAEQYEARIKDLKSSQASAGETGVKVRSEVEAYSGLIGRGLEVAGKLFTGYEPVKVRELPSPTIPPNILLAQETLDLGDSVSKPDSYVDIYNEYVEKNDPDKDGVFNTFDNCPNTQNPDQADRDGDNEGDACDLNDNSNIEPVTTTTTEEIVEPATNEEPLVEENVVEENIVNNPDEAPVPETEAPESNPDVEIIDLPSAVE
jgi:hypothetical protein